MPGPVFAAVELGGMTIRVAIAEGTVENIVDRTTFKTGTDPAAVMSKIVQWLEKKQPFDCLGVASFGPIDPRQGSATFGQITSTPKVAWRNYDVLAALDVFGVPTGFDTDVNAPAMYEYAYAASQPGNEGMSSAAYITVGTGVGIGLVVNGKPVHGMLHPEGGHMPYPNPDGDTFKGTPGATIPNGIESNVSAGALALRAGLDHPDGLQGLPDSHPVWEFAVHYLAGACVNLALLASPEKIVLGGGVLNRVSLFPRIRAKVQAVLNGYLQVDQITTDKINEWIVPGTHGPDAGIIGALALAQAALTDAVPGLEEPASTAADGTAADSTVGPLASLALGVVAGVVIQRIISSSL